MAEKRIIIIAGPNGAGKTTFAREYLPFEVGITTFINADLIAAGLSPFAPELVARRFRAGLRNFEALYRPLVNEWQIIDNAESTPRLLSEGGQP